MTPKPPSIKELTIIPNKPAVYEAYMYLIINIFNGIWYLGIKKDLLPEDGGSPYWTSSTNDEFTRLLQGSAEIFRIEIIKFSDYITLKQKEYIMLKEVPNIKTNPITYNLSYGMPPIGKDSLVDEKFLKWLKDQYESGIWDSKEKEKVSDLKKMNTKQIRYVDKKSHVDDIAYELSEVCGNTDLLKPILIFEGVGGLFGFDEGEDIVVGSRHGLEAADKVNSEEVHTRRVPYWVFENKTALFVESCAHNDNSIEDLIYKPTSDDVAKLLTELHHEKEGTQDEIDVMSDYARDYVRMVYGIGIGKKTIETGQKTAETWIEMGKRDAKWIHYKRQELIDETKKYTNNKTICIYMSTSKYNESRIVHEFRKDEKPNKKGKILKRKKLIILFYHKNDHDRKQFELDCSSHMANLRWCCDHHDCEVEFKYLDYERPDTDNDYLEKNEPTSLTDTQFEAVTV